ncbi:MAG: hypothetical protein IJ766_09935 [Clostridia bacterium]|nr:hypothetical protein [Clostridia bacterium]
MKKTIFGSALMICGVIAAVGFLIMKFIDPFAGVRSFLNLTGDQIAILLVFLLISVCGFVIAIRSIKRD